MRIVVGFLRSGEGRAALERAIEEAKLRDAVLTVVHTLTDDPEVVAEYREEFEQLGPRLESEGIEHDLHQYVRGNSPAEDLLQVAEETDADLLVIGVRRRSPVGKLVLGSNAQKILLGADCPVLAVKAAAE